MSPGPKVIAPSPLPWSKSLMRLASPPGRRLGRGKIRSTLAVVGPVDRNAVGPIIMAHESSVFFSGDVRGGRIATRNLVPARRELSEA